MLCVPFVRPVMCFLFSRLHVVNSLILWCSLGSTCASFAIVGSPVVLDSQVGFQRFPLELFLHSSSYSALNSLRPNLFSSQHTVPGHEVEEWQQNLSEREYTGRQAAPSQVSSKYINVNGTTPGGAIVMDHMLRHGMWAPVETRLFHHIILVCARFLVFSSNCLCWRLLLRRLSIFYHSRHH